MSTTPTDPNPGAAQAADPQAYYQDLYDSLNAAYWKADQDGRDKIGKSADAVFVILTAITQAKLEKNTQQLEDLSDLVQKTNGELEDLQTDLHKIVKVAEVVGTVEFAIHRVLSLAGNIIPA